MSNATMFWVELVCNTCAATIGGRFVSGGHIPVRSMKNEAKGAGWWFIGSRSYCSERCKNYTPEPTE